MKTSISLMLVAIVLSSVVVVAPSLPPPTTADSSSCPSSAMYYAVRLSDEVNESLPNPNSVTQAPQVASAIDGVVPYINDQFNLNVPLVTSSTHGVTLLIAPYEAFYTTSKAVNRNQPDSACNFLIATFTLAAFVVIVSTSGVDGVVAFSTIEQYCGNSCATQVFTNITNFVAEYYSSASSAWGTIACTAENNCTPEFPPQPVFIALMTSVMVVLYAFIRRRTIQPASGRPGPR